MEEVTVSLWLEQGHVSSVLHGSCNSWRHYAERPGASVLMAGQPHKPSEVPGASDE